VGTIYLEGARERTARARHLVHVRETDVVGDEAIELESRSEAQQLLVPRLEELRSLGVDAEGEIIASVGRHTDVARQILERARTRGVELIVLGPPRQHGVTETLLGDVTAEIVRHAPCDVLIVTPRPASVVA
jgi:nucleotide-binding universal stress UspA family protein